jgi:uncharacterized membrane protein (UPF0127 family)
MNPMQRGYVKIGNNSLRAVFPTTAEGKRVGMMGRRFDTEFQCMVFQFDTVERSFWMKNCIIPLDMIFVLDGVVSSIAHSCPPCLNEPCPSYKGMGQEVIEVDGGEFHRLGINVGDSVKYLYSS